MHKGDGREFNSFDNRVERLQEYLFTKNGGTNFRDFETSKGILCNVLTISYAFRRQYIFLNCRKCRLNLANI